LERMGFELRNMVNVPPDDGHRGGAPDSILLNVAGPRFVSPPAVPPMGLEPILERV
jgi:hypothetical protein